MYAQADPVSERDALNSILHIASSIRKQLTDLYIPKPRHSIPSNFDSLIPELYISVPPDVYARLSTLEIPHNLLRALQQRLDVFIDNLKRQYRSAYRKSCLEIYQGTNGLNHIRSLHGTYQALVERQFLPTIRSQVSYIADEVAKRQSPSVDSKRQFNNEFTPVLEKYFEMNGYPSVAHRSILAQKSGMIPRQIEVWFQNHRNRAKKEGKRVERLHSDFPLRQALGLLRQVSAIRQNRLPTPPSEESVTDVVGNKTGDPMKIPIQRPALGLPTLLDDSYHASRPPHAYPMTMKSQCPDPFPSEDGIFKFPPPEWIRKPATAPSVATAVDMDEFSQLFHLKLNFAENSRHRGPVPSSPESSTPWFLATTIIPSTAPHPAFIRTSYILQSISRPLSNPLISKPTFGSTSLPSSSVYHHDPPSEVPRRKTLPLPRRTPTSHSNSFSSRSSSFNSVASSSSRISSSSSNYSSSPEVSTPPSLPNLDLPIFTDVRQEQDLFDFSHTEVETGYFLQVPPQDFNLANIYPGSNKFTDTPLFDNLFPDFAHNLGEILS